MIDRDGRLWICEASYPNRKPFLFGHIAAPKEAKEMEVERMFHAAIPEYLPEGFRITKLIPGQLIFLEESA